MRVFKWTDSPAVLNIKVLLLTFFGKMSFHVCLTKTSAICALLNFFADLSASRGIVNLLSYELCAILCEDKNCKCTPYTLPYFLYSVDLWCVWRLDFYLWMKFIHVVGLSSCFKLSASWSSTVFSEHVKVIHSWEENSIQSWANNFQLV